MNCTLPKTVEVGGTERAIRWDYRPILDICAALADPELDSRGRAVVALSIFYPELEDIPQEDLEEAAARCMWFVGGGRDGSKGNAPRLVDWEQDFGLIVGPVNRVLGQEIREEAPLHWFTFLSAYFEIGECTFSQVVRIREHLARGRPLDRSDREWYRRNRELVDFKRKYTGDEDELIKNWGGG